MRARLGPASRAATQCGATLMSIDFGTMPFTAPTRPVGRLAGKMGLTSARATVALLTPIMSAVLVASAAIRPYRIRIRVFKQGRARATRIRPVASGMPVVASVVIEDDREIG